MTSAVRVSIVIIFLNEERFLAAAIESVQSQTYCDWELLLVDDGSVDRSSDIARQYAAVRPDRVRYLEHPGHENQGMSASRNLGIQHARGEFIGFLDADDLYTPEKLQEQVSILESHPAAGFVCGSAQWWYGWTGDAADQGRDFVQRYKLPLDAVSRSPLLLLSYLADEWSSPCDMLVRRALVDRVGGYEPIFRGMYEDQAFHAKLSLHSDGYVSSRCWYRYRQHPDACTAVSHQSGKTQAARRAFLDWLDAYISRHAPRAAEARQEVKRLRFPYRYPRLSYWLKRLARASAHS